MPKSGIFHDYDLWANMEESARRQTCIICNVSPMTFQWSDYSGEAMCTNCGFPYQLKWGSEEQQKGGKYPYINIHNFLVEPIKEYWKLKEEFVCYGMMMRNRPGIDEFFDWLKHSHPDLYAKLK